MIDLLIGAAALIFVLAVLHGLTHADPKSLAKGLRYLSAAALALAGAFFLVRGIIPIAVLLGSAAYGVFTGGRILPGGWPHWHFPRGGGTTSQSSQTTLVTTEWLELELEHDTGEMRGRVLRGAFAGKSLRQLTDDELLRYYAEAGSADLETARLLEAYFDRRLGSDWRAKAGDTSSQSQQRSNSGMTRDEAYRVLGLPPDASDENIRDAYKRLMMNLHPDRGGTDYLAAKINQAKDVLLG